MVKNRVAWKVDGLAAILAGSPRNHGTLPTIFPGPAIQTLNNGTPFCLVVFLRRNLLRSSGETERNQSPTHEVRLEAPDEERVGREFTVSNLLARQTPAVANLPAHPHP